MKIDFEAYQWLFLIIPIVFLLWWIAKKSKQKESLSVRRMLLTLRSLICILLILSLSGIRITSQGKDTVTLFLVDASDSVSHAEGKIEDFLKQAEEAKKSTDAVGIITFGETATLEGKIGKETSLNEKRQGFVNKEASDVSNALSLAVGLLPQEDRKRIVVVSDGLETQGDMAVQSKLLKATPGLTVDVFPLAISKEPEVQLTQLKLAKAIRVNADYEIAMQIDSTSDNRVNVKLFKGNELIADKWVDVVKGRNNLLFKDRTTQGGRLVYRGEITAQMDKETKNNRAYAYTNITDVPNLLLIANEGEGAALKNLLQASAQNVTSMLPQAAPQSLTELSRYDGVLLCNVSFKQMPEGFLEVLEAYLRTTGGGLFVTGGEHSFALGGYMGTAMEKILPVDMDLKTPGEEPSLSMVMVIDRSGSMMQEDYGVSKMEMAKEAAIRSLPYFKAEDSLGVIAFDDRPTWVVPLQQVGEAQEKIQSDVARVQPGGGTSILPAVEEAFSQISTVSAKQKHILLLTDGQAEQTGYEALMARMKQGGVTLSAIAVGNDADTALCKRLAQLGGGRYYETNVFTDLPEIFAQETMLAGKEYINYRHFYPVLGDMPELLAGIQQIPALHGFIATTAKERADVVLKTDEEEPVLAFWQYGLGRSGVWTADVDGMFSADWLQSSEGVKVLLNAISYVTKKPSSAEINVTAVSKGNESLIRLETPFIDGYQNIEAQITDDNGQPVEASAPRAVSPGVYEMTAKIKEGAYFLNLTAEKENGQKELFQSGFAAPYPQEYDLTLAEKGEPALKNLAFETGGRVLTNGKEVFEKEAQSVASPKKLSGGLLWLALCLFLLDVAFRRLPAMRYGAQRYLGWLFAPASGKKKEKRTKENNTEKQEQKKKQSDEKTKQPGATAASPKETPSTAQMLANAKRKRNR